MVACEIKMLHEVVKCMILTFRALDYHDSGKQLNIVKGVNEWINNDIDYIEAVTWKADGWRWGE